MPKIRNIYDLFGPTSFSNWERLIADGKIPTNVELADILEANCEEPLPPWFIETVVKSLRGELRRKAGRPKEGALMAQIVICAARIVTARWLKQMSWRAFLNRISS